MFSFCPGTSFHEDDSLLRAVLQILCKDRNNLKDYRCSIAAKATSRLWQNKKNASHAAILHGRRSYDNIVLGRAYYCQSSDEVLSNEVELKPLL